MSKVVLSVEPSESAQLRGRELVEKVIDPEIAAFEKWFSEKANGGSSLTRLERELFRAYLYQKITGGIR